MKIQRIKLAAFLLTLGFAQIVQAEEGAKAWFCKPQTDGKRVHWIQSKLGQQKVGVVIPQPEAENSDLVVFLHGDSPFSDPIYQYRIAESIGKKRNNTIAAGILRPGYRDKCGDQSAGDVGQMMGDNYSASAVEAIADVIEGLQKSYQPKRTYLIGHSGGAALSALLSARQSQLIDQTVLVACPCDLPKWRTVMRNLTGKENWERKLPGLSAIDEVSDLDDEKKIHLFVGYQDRVTPSFLSEEYAAKATELGKKVSVTVKPNADHENILRPEILKEILASIGD